MNFDKASVYLGVAAYAVAVLGSLLSFREFRGVWRLTHLAGVAGYALLLAYNAAKAAGHHWTDEHAKWAKRAGYGALALAALGELGHARQPAYLLAIAGYVLLILDRKAFGYAAATLYALLAGKSDWRRAEKFHSLGHALLAALYGALFVLTLAGDAKDTSKDKSKDTPSKSKDKTKKKTS